MNTASPLIPSSLLAPGTRIRGVYMGGEFTGTITKIESNASGYAIDRYHQRVWWRTDRDVMYGHDRSFRRPAGAELIIDVQSDGRGNYRRDDSRYESLFVVRQ